MKVGSLFSNEVLLCARLIDLISVCRDEVKEQVWKLQKALASSQGISQEGHSTEMTKLSRKLIFCDNTQTLERISEGLARAGLRHAVAHEKMSPKDRSLVNLPPPLFFP